MFRGRPVVFESHLPGRLGVSRDLIRELRESALENEDWFWDGNRVVWSTSGVAKLSERITQFSQDKPQEVGGGPDTPQKPAIVPGPESAPEEFVTVKVLRPYPNNHWLKATLAGGVVDVRVHNARRFLPNQNLQVVRVNGNLYEAYGRQWLRM